MVRLGLLGQHDWPHSTCLIRAAVDDLWGQEGLLQASVLNPSGTELLPTERVVPHGTLLALLTRWARSFRIEDLTRKSGRRGLVEEIS